jgi:hypothetical protein
VPLQSLSIAIARLAGMNQQKLTLSTQHKIRCFGWQWYFFNASQMSFSDRELAFWTQALLWILHSSCLLFHNTSICGIMADITLK